MKRPWMPLYVGDYLGDTGHLTTTQHGAYLLLMMHYWRKGELPDDDKQLSKITKLPFKVWVEYRETLQGFFHDGWKHKRIDAEIYKTENIRRMRKDAGYKGGMSSALARIKLESAGLSKHVSSQANGRHVPSKAQAPVEYSQSHISSSEDGTAREASPMEKPQVVGEGRPAKPPPLVASPELVASLTKRTH